MFKKIAVIALIPPLTGVALGWGCVWCAAGLVEAASGLKRHIVEKAARSKE